MVEEVYRQRFDEYQITYVNDKGDMMLLRQSGYKEGIMGNITSGFKGMDKVTVNDFMGYYVRDVDTANLVLTDGEYVIELFGNLSKKELISLAKRLQLEE